MPRRSLLVGSVATMLLASGPMAGVAQNQPDTLQESSIDLGDATVRSPDEKIAELSRKIMEMQARGQTGPALGDLYNDLGVIHAQLEDWAPARDALIRAVQAKPYDPDVHRNLGLVFLNLEDYDLAIAELTAYRDTGGPAALDAYRLLAQTYLKVDDPAGARAAYQDGLQALGRVPSAETCRLALALAGFERAQGNGEDVRRVLETWQPVAREWRQQAAADGTTDGVAEAEAIENNLVAIYLEDGQILEDSGLGLEAVELYQKAFALAPDRDELLPRIVGAYLAAGDPFQAKVTARLARQDHPERAGAWTASAKVYEAEGQLRDAVDAYRKAYEIAPETPGLRLKIGTVYMQLGDAAEGRRYLAEAIDAPDTPTEVVFNYAVSLVREEKYSAALAPLQRVTREAPEFAGGWQALALCYREKKQYSQAVAAYKQALALQPDANTAYNLGVTAGRAELWDEAVAAYDQALALDPNHREAGYNRAVALMQAGRLEEAEEAFAAYLARDPEHYKANLNHGVTLYKLGRYDEAIAAYNGTLELKETAEAWDNLGLAYQGRGDKQKAQACFQEAKKLRGKT